MATIIGVWAVSGTAMAAASSWSIEPSPTPVGTNATLTGVSCATAVNCTAVGDSLIVSPFAQVPITERRGSNGWTIEPTPIPAGATTTVLMGVSCSAGNACTAVGTTSGSASGSAVLVERWNGTVWQIQSAPDPTGSANNQLNAISCPTANSCQAVGTTAENFAQPTALAEAWNGSSWTIDPTPPGAGDLTGVSCTAADACTAVGSAPTDAGSQTAAVRWNGTAWNAQTTAGLASENNTNQLNAVSCAAGLACTAVGYRGSAGHGFLSSTLAEGWRGGAWSTQPTFSFGISALNGVSCTRPNACTAVGSDEALPNGGTTTQRWNGSAWHVQSTPTSETAASLASVSCPTLRQCTAVGSVSTGTLIERYHG